MLVKKRKNIKLKAQIQKEEIVEKFEEMKCKGKIDVRVLEKYGIDVSPDRSPNTARPQPQRQNPGAT